MQTISINFLSYILKLLNAIRNIFVANIKPYCIAMLLRSKYRSYTFAHIFMVKLYANEKDFFIYHVSCNNRDGKCTGNTGRNNY